MEKLKKILFPVDIALGALIVIMIVLIVIVNVTKGSQKYSPSDKAAKTEDTQGAEASIKTSFDGYEVKADVKTSTNDTKNPTLSDANGYFFANSDTVAISEADLTSLDAECLYYAKCEIYARHGYVFADSATNAYFEKKSWYTADSSYDLSTLTDIEKSNYETIEGYMKSNNLSFTPQ